MELGIALENVHQVLAQLPTRPLPFGPPYLRETFDLGDEPVCVLDLARALGVEHRVPLADRRLVLMRHEQLLVALCVDAVRDPEEFLAQDVVLRERVGGTDHGRLARVLRAVVRRRCEVPDDAAKSLARDGGSGRGSLAIVDPLALLSPDLIAEVAAALSRTSESVVHRLEAP
jgi:chemotaxis signal transduction protein